MDEGEIEIRIEGEESDAAAGSTTSRIAELNRQADADHARAARLNLQTAHLRREAEMRRVGNELLTVDSESKAAEAAYRNAREYGDTDAEVAATRRLSAAEARRNTLELQGQALERIPVSSGDAFEDHLSRFTDRTAQWMREHRDWVEDPKKNAKMVGAHHMAVGDGLEPDTPEYFAHVERQLGLRSGGNGSNRSGTNMRRETPKYDPADHRTHVTPDGVYLTENERKLATDGTLVFNTGPKRGQPIGLSEMARRKSEMAKNGMYNRI
jgi:hypothetical protein